MISYIDDNRILARAEIDKDYRLIDKRLRLMMDEFDAYATYGDALVAYKISVNKPLTNLYGFSFFVVKFFLTGITNLHDDGQEALLLDLLNQLKVTLTTTKGYYNLRIPTHVVDLIKVFNQVFPSHIFCGGTVEEYTSGRQVMMPDVPGIDIFRLSDETMPRYKDGLSDIARASFASYQGQYHISPVTLPKAGQIYVNWITSALDSSPSQVCAITSDGRLAGFALTEYDKTNRVSDMLLTCIDESMRGKHIYKSLIAHLINEAYANDAAFVSSTQFDNYGSQHTWASLGMVPFYSIYNMHIDLR